MLVVAFAGGVEGEAGTKAVDDVVVVVVVVVVVLFGGVGVGVGVGEREGVVIGTRARFVVVVGKGILFNILVNPGFLSGTIGWVMGVVVVIVRGNMTNKKREYYFLYCRWEYV